MNEQIDKNEDTSSKNDLNLGDTKHKSYTDTLQYPFFVKKAGIWPINLGLFFFYNNIISLIVLTIGVSIILYTNGALDQQTLSEKLGGLSVISTLLTLGITLIYSHKFYFRKK